jgi:hypothetical protein
MSEEESMVLERMAENQKALRAELLAVMERSKEARAESEKVMDTIMFSEKDARIAELEEQIANMEAEQAVLASELSLKMAKLKKKFTNLIFWTVILALLLFALFLIGTWDVSADELRVERDPKPVLVGTQYGDSLPILVQPPTGDPSTVELLEVDGWAQGCDNSNGWTTGYQGHLSLIFSPTTSNASVEVTFQHAPAMGDQTYDLVDGSQSLTREEWLGITLAAGEVWNYVDSGQEMSYDTTGVDGVLAAHDYLFQEACLR